MINSLAIVPPRSLLRGGLRITCRCAGKTTSNPSTSPFQLLSTWTCTPPRTLGPPSWSPLHYNPWTSPAARVLQTRHVSSSPADFRDVLREYEDLPLDYKDREGLPFRNTDLTDAEVQEIFGSGMKPAAAKRLLRILHGRRVAGTLDDPILSINTASFKPDQRAVALEYLRETVPVDEVLNAGLRAEDELLRLEAELEGKSDDTKSEGSSKTPLKDAKAAEVKPDPVYGYSVMDAIRAKNMAKAKAKEAQLSLEAHEAEKKGLPPPGSALPIKRPAMTPRMQEWMKKGGSDLEASPSLSLAERILPSAAVVVLLAGTLATFAMVYVPPREAERLFPEISASAVTVGTLVGLNALVFLAWKVPPLWRFLNTNFTLVHGMPRALSMVTTNFSHQTMWHLVTNMAGLWFIGTALHDEIGRANFLAIYLSSGAVGLLGSLITFTLRGVFTVSTTGASGGVFGVAMAYFWMHRFDTFKVFGLPPEPINGPQGLGFIAVILGVHIFALLRKGKQTIDLASHLFGMLAGVVGIGLVTRREQVQKKSRGDLVKDAPPRQESGENVKA